MIMTNFELDEDQFRKYMTERAAQRAKNRPKAKRKPPKHKKGSHPHITRFLKMVSKLNYGIDSKRYKYSTDTAIKRYNKRWMCGFSKDQLVDHEAGKITLFYMSSELISNPEILIVLDVDVKKDHQTEDQAIRFLEFLKTKNEFKSLVYETSTSGKGKHAYLVFKKHSSCVIEVDHALRTLLKKLKPIADYFGVDFEIKGTQSKVGYNRDRKIDDLTFGSLCRVPRNIEKALKSTVIDQRFINLLRISAPKMLIAPKDLVQKIAVRSTSVVSGEMLLAIPMLTQDFAETIKSNPIKQSKSNRHRVVADDLAIFAVLSASMKPDNNRGLPVLRFKELWNALYRDGIINRAFCSTRFKIVRDWFSMLGHINWIDNRYYVYKKKDKRTKDEMKARKKDEKGICCRWGISGVLREFVQNRCDLTADNTHTSTVRTQVLAVGIHGFQKPIFSGTMVDRRRDWLIWAENRLEFMFAA